MVQYQTPKYEYTPSSFRTFSLLTVVVCGIFSPLSLVFSIPALLFSNKVSRKNRYYEVVSYAQTPTKKLDFFLLESACGRLVLWHPQKHLFCVCVSAKHEGGCMVLPPACPTYKPRLQFSLLRRQCSLVASILPQSRQSQLKPSHLHVESIRLVPL